MATEKQINYINNLHAKVGYYVTPYALKHALGDKLTTADQMRGFFTGKQLNAEKVSEMTVDEASAMISYMQNQKCVCPPLAKYLKQKMPNTSYVMTADTPYSTLVHIAQLHNIDVPEQMSPF